MSRFTVPTLVTPGVVSRVGAPAAVASVSMRDYGDVLSGPSRRKQLPQVPAEVDLVVEVANGGFCGAVVGLGRAVDAGEKRDTVVLEDRHGNRREFAMLPAAFLVDGRPVTLVRPAPTATPAGPRAKTASGSYAVAGAKARVARSSRLWVEGVHDAALLERIWGDDLRVEGVVVEPLDGIDDLVSHVREFAPTPQRRIGVLVDHLVPGSKETRIVSEVRNPNVLVNGHPYIDIWQAVKPTALGIDAWPVIPRGINWKDGICAALHVSDPREMWRRVLGSVDTYADVEVPLLRAVEELIDFVTVTDEP